MFVSNLYDIKAGKVNRGKHFFTINEKQHVKNMLPSIIIWGVSTVFRLLQRQQLSVEY